MRKAQKSGWLDPIDKQINRIITKVEHPLCVIKRQFGHMKTPYRGFAPTLSVSKRSRNFSAWLGWVPRKHSTGGEQVLG